MSGQIFIVYRPDDASSEAGRVYDRLSTHCAQNRISMDANAAPEINPAEPGPKDGNPSCDVLIAIIGKRWLDASDEEGKRRLDDPEDFVRTEIGTALKRGIRVIPVLVEGALMPRSGELPDELKALVRRRAINVSPDQFLDDLEQLTGAVQRALKTVRTQDRRDRQEQAPVDIARRAQTDREPLQAGPREQEAVRREPRHEEQASLNAEQQLLVHQERQQTDQGAKEGLEAARRHQVLQPAEAEPPPPAPSIPVRFPTRWSQQVSKPEEAKPSSGQPNLDTEPLTAAKPPGDQTLQGTNAGSGAPSSPDGNARNVHRSLKGLAVGKSTTATSLPPEPVKPPIQVVKEDPDPAETGATTHPMLRRPLVATGIAAAVLLLGMTLFFEARRPPSVSVGPTPPSTPPPPAITDNSTNTTNTVPTKIISTPAPDVKNPMPAVIQVAPSPTEAAGEAAPSPLPAVSQAAPSPTAVAAEKTLPGPVPAVSQAASSPAVAVDQPSPGPAPAVSPVAPGPAPLANETTPGPTPAANGVSPGLLPALSEAAPGSTPAGAEGLGEARPYLDAKDYATALPLLLKAADAGDTESMNQLGELYCYSRGVPQDYGRAYELYSKAAEAGNAAAMTNLGGLYEKGWGRPQDYTQARLWYQKAGEAGDAEGMYSLAWLYRKGWGGAQDYTQARQWFQKAAEAGNAPAMYNLGGLYRNGQGGARDYAQARLWFQKAAEAGNAPAMVNLGVLYRNGEGGPRDYAQARQWFQKAAEAGNAYGMSSLGELYRNGEGGPRDYARARQWFQKAAEDGNADAMANLGYLYHNGWGVRQDYVQARQWYQKAAAAGNTAAMYNLGVLYRNGQGVARDYAQAREWYQQAAGSGNADAKQALSKLPAKPGRWFWPWPWP